MNLNCEVVTNRGNEARIERFVSIYRCTIVNVAVVHSHTHKLKLKLHQNGEYFVTVAGGKELRLSRGYRVQLARFA